MWYKRKDGTEVYKEGRYKVVEIYKKDKRKFNGEYTFYTCFVWNKGEVVASEGVHGSALRKKYQAIRWAMKKARELKIIKL